MKATITGIEGLEVEGTPEEILRLSKLLKAAKPMPTPQKVVVVQKAAPTGKSVVQTTTPEAVRHNRRKKQFTNEEGQQAYDLVASGQLGISNALAKVRGTTSGGHLFKKFRAWCYRHGKGGWYNDHFHKWSKPAKLNHPERMKKRIAKARKVEDKEARIQHQRQLLYRAQGGHTIDEEARAASAMMKKRDKAPVFKTVLHNDILLSMLRNIIGTRGRLTYAGDAYALGIEKKVQWDSFVEEVLRRQREVLSYFGAKGFFQVEGMGRGYTVLHYRPRGMTR